MNKEQKRCGHHFEMPKGWRRGVYFSGDCVYIPVFCSNCGLKADEVFVYSNRLGLDGEEVLENDTG